MEFAEKTKISSDNFSLNEQASEKAAQREVSVGASVLSLI